MDPAVAPRRILAGQANDPAPNVGIDGRSARPSRWWLGPAAGDESSVPSEDCRRAHDQQRPATTRPVHYRGEKRQHCPVLLVEPRPVDLSLQHQDLMAQSEDLGVTGLRAGEQPSTPRQDEPSAHG